MALADLMKKGYLTSAIATAATSATSLCNLETIVAIEAGVAVANNLSIQVPSITLENKHPKPEQNILAMMSLFKFDELQGEITDEKSTIELDRLNNMAWEFMQNDGMAFSEAITLAASIVINCQRAQCEAAYIEVKMLYKELVAKQAFL